MRWLCLTLALTACTTNAYGDRVGDSRFALRNERCEWGHREGDRFRRAWVETLRATEGLGGRRKVRGEVCFLTPPVMVWGVERNGFSTGTGGTATAWVRDDLDDAATERQALHEWLHSLGGDREHRDPRWWRPTLTSAEARATCALQERFCE